jgi:hypothetical protein
LGRAFLINKKKENMSLLEQIQNWLLSEKRDFQSGLQMYINASHNRSIMLYLQRKSDQRKLEYELQKLAKQMPARLEKMPAIDMVPIAVSTPVEKPKIEKPAGKHKILEPRRINRDDLPEELHIVYDAITGAYKEQRVFHEKMKLAKTDEERKILRGEVIKCDQVISVGWDKLDEWQLLKSQGGTFPPKEKEKEESSADVAKTINACRSYVSKGVAALPGLDAKKAEARMVEIRKRIEILIKLGVTVKKETRDQLVTLKVIAEDSPLKIETPEC